VTQLPAKITFSDSISASSSIAREIFPVTLSPLRYTLLLSPSTTILKAGTVIFGEKKRDDQQCRDLARLKSV
jgi:hypothetical protein